MELYVLYDTGGTVHLATLQVPEAFLLFYDREVAESECLADAMPHQSLVSSILRTWGPSYRLFGLGLLQDLISETFCIDHSALPTIKISMRSRPMRGRFVSDPPPPISYHL